MKKIKSLLSVTVAILVVGLSSCGSDGPGSMNKSDAQAAFASVNSNLGAALTDLNGAPGAIALNSFSELSSSGNIFGRVSSHKREQYRDQVKASLNAVRSMLTFSSSNGRVAGDEPFNFDTKKGKYYYNFETGMFDKDGASDFVQIYYPSEGAETRNTEFRLTNYAEDEAYNATLVEATVYTIDENYTAQDIIAQLDLAASYDDLGEPEFGDVTIGVTPFELEIKFDDRKETSSSASERLSKDGSTLIAIGISAVFYDSYKEEPKRISAYLQLMSVRFVMSFDMESADENTDDITDLVHVSIKVDGKDAGRIVFEYEPNSDEPTPYVKYKDGSTEPLEDVFGALAAELDGLFGGSEPI